MMDRYYPVAQYLADGLEELEDIVVENSHPGGALAYSVPTDGSSWCCGE